MLKRRLGNVFRQLALCLTVLGILTACGGGGTPPPASNNYTIGGTVTGLGGDLVLRNSNTTSGSSEDYTVSVTPFTFPTALPDQNEFSITIVTNPVGQTCTVSANGSGRIAGADVTDVIVTCSDLPPPTGDSGSLDPDFGTGGKVTTDFSGSLPSIPR